VLDCSESLGRVKTALRRFAVLTRPARSLVLAITGATMPDNSLKEPSNCARFYGSKPGGA